MRFRDDIPVECNVLLQLRDRRGRVVDERRGHNIFVNYGREWLSELISLDTGYTPFRSDRIKSMAVGIGGIGQTMDAATLRSTWAGFPNHWGYTNPADPTTGSYGDDGTAGSGNPQQTAADPTVTGLEYPVQITSADYYDHVYAPVAFPTAGSARFTSVFGFNEVSFGAATSVPISEIGLFTESASTPDLPPLPQDRSVSPPVPANPPAGVRFMVAYHTFNPISKTSGFVLQVDWELRFA